MARIAQIFNEIITRFGGWPKWNAGKGESKRIFLISISNSIFTDFANSEGDCPKIGHGFVQ
jgi:hypothetical protein